ncbi:MAG: PEP-CTERM sorting domain-containing protein [Deltaproteobacteria bacterium]|nr:PEP-CTERM sorting domain-containing protein [Deltaproteobacteria bacterium]MBW2361383.1 PEP-CTERM sorting domain-containing protein [Deltaproteobacteria bacterium]
MFRNSLWLAWLALVAFAAGPACAAPLVSEVFYDASGSDDGLSFVELWGAAGASLDGLVIEGINGSNGSVTHTLVLTGVIPADGFFVIADDRGDGASDVAGADLVRDFDFQNGPDSVVLRDAAGVFDAVGYGNFAVGDVFAGEGAPASDAPAGSSLARLFANGDSDDNAADFVVLPVPTPGSGELLPVPEPGTSTLCLLGLVGLRARRRRRAG